MKTLVAALIVLLLSVAVSASASPRPSGIRGHSYIGGPLLERGESAASATNLTIVVARGAQTIAVVHKEPHGVFVLRLAPAVYELTPELEGERCGGTKTVRVRHGMFPAVKLYCSVP
jgi:hypothetical protein